MADAAEVRTMRVMLVIFFATVATACGPRMTATQCKTPEECEELYCVEEIELGEASFKATYRWSDRHHTFLKEDPLVA
jgi:hypothetical protein